MIENIVCTSLLFCFSVDDRQCEKKSTLENRRATRICLLSCHTTSRPAARFLAVANPYTHTVAVHRTTCRSSLMLVSKEQACLLGGQTRRTKPKHIVTIVSKRTPLPKKYVPRNLQTQRDARPQLVQAWGEKDRDEHIYKLAGNVWGRWGFSNFLPKHPCASRNSTATSAAKFPLLMRNKGRKSSRVFHQNPATGQRGCIHLRAETNHNAACAYIA